jgi:hypothetical protein
LTLGGNGITSAFVRFDTGETEEWVAPFTTRFGADGQSLDIILQTERCGDLQFLAVLGSSDLQLITHGAASRARPCRLNSSKAPAWKLSLRWLIRPRISRHSAQRRAAPSARLVVNCGACTLAVAERKLACR